MSGPRQVAPKGLGKMQLPHTDAVIHVHRAGWHALHAVEESADTRLQMQGIVLHDCGKQEQSSYKVHRIMPGMIDRWEASLVKAAHRSPSPTLKRVDWLSGLVGAEASGPLALQWSPRLSLGLCLWSLLLCDENLDALHVSMSLHCMHEILKMFHAISKKMLLRSPQSCWASLWQRPRICQSLSA